MGQKEPAHVIGFLRRESTVWQSMSSSSSSVANEWLDELMICIEAMKSNVSFNKGEPNMSFETFIIQSCCEDGKVSVAHHMEENSSAIIPYVSHSAKFNLLCE